MTKRIIVGFIGADKPGLVQELTEIVGLYDGNWLESRMSRLEGMFAGVARVEVSSDKINELTKALEAVEDMTITVRQPPESVAAEELGEVVRMTLNIIGPDRTGILREVTNALTPSVVNVIEMETRVAPAPMSGEPTFYSDAVVELPFSADRALLVERLNEIGSDIGVDILLDEILE